MKIPRDLGGEELARLLGKYGYKITRQTGSHMRLTSSYKGAEHHITIPRHASLKVGTLSNILKDVASYLEIEKERLIKYLFSL
ncbi:MAG: type II toxin-antitoxin system HicA family toxin [Nitrospirae bacterium]|nr:type II toxin-antitoxin system HicA family toxin [Nitrospirota bacterium]